MLKSWLAKAALIYLSTSLTLGAFDLVIYLFPRDLLPLPFRKLTQMMEINSHRYYARDPKIGYVIRPGTDFFFLGEEFSFRLQTRLNFPNAGFRGGTLGGPAWGAAFGDSFTFGAGVDQEATWVARLSQLTQHEIINFGMPGHGPHQYTRIFQEYGAPLRPKLVFYALFTNDLRDGVRFESPPAERKPKMSLKRFMKRYSASYNVFRNVSRSLKKTRTTETQDDIGLQLPERRLRNPYGVLDGRFASAWAASARQIEDAIEESKRIDATFVLLYFPSKEEVYWELARERIKPIDGFEERIGRFTRHVLEFCASRDLLCLDLTAALKTRGLRGEKFYYPVDIHWNQQGNAVVAQEIYKFLVEKKLI
jgi:hypothetical protein